MGRIEVEYSPRSRQTYAHAMMEDGTRADVIFATSKETEFFIETFSKQTEISILSTASTFGLYLIKFAIEHNYKIVEEQLTRIIRRFEFTKVEEGELAGNGYISQTANQTVNEIATDGSVHGVKPNTKFIFKEIFKTREAADSYISDNKDIFEGFIPEILCLDVDRFVIFLERKEEDSHGGEQVNSEPTTGGPDA